jgi:hypothetical protein
MAAMTVAYGTSRLYERRERELLAARRRKTEGRVARERARNSRLALCGFIALALLMTLGIRTSWAPPAPTSSTMSMRVGTDPESRKFAKSHLGRLFLTSLDDAICRELQFNNDTGRFSNDRPVRCDEPETREDTADVPPVVDSRVRTLSLRNGFGR